MPPRSVKLSATKSTKPQPKNSAAEKESDFFVELNVKNGEKTRVEPPAKIGSLADEDQKVELAYIIRAHSKAPLGSDDDETQVWACEFEPPSVDENGQSVASNIVATCGGNTVCFIDCHQGKIMTKYTHLESTEEFYTLSWTTLEDNNSHILAVAGKLGVVRLINPLQGVCFRYLVGHSKQINQIRFSTKNPRWLFSASYDDTIRLWDIGSSAVDSDNSICLAKFSGVGHLNSFCVHPSDQYLFAGCVDGGIYKYNVSDLLHHNPSSRQGIAPDSLNQFKPSEDTHNSAIECMTFLNQDLVVSRAAEDGRIVVWNATKSARKTLICEQMIGFPENSEGVIKFRTVPDLDGTPLFISGDPAGNIHIIELSDTEEPFEWVIGNEYPQCNRLIRDVAISDSFKYIVSVDIDNRIMIWVKHN
ncbi:WD40 repeat-like protein [Basidiobolus meristosporus CBS 931.73]|uniref:WD40 repeat-like protein n=1 Tax=Basidiobolus meristosporus CBS 931.73 TaxID=1314790 RepID=A0A1Y1XS50_9FUNG|nr:WD40 repeat-like protein [Basidiobolus meristosporus CBS 931.73]|eukprot:ORX88582.1 WD40 repeat-like protein [Basidiobolus meristosporus CBS 931.73]